MVLVEIKSEDTGGMTGTLCGLIIGAARVPGLAKFHPAKDDQDTI